MSKVKAGNELSIVRPVMPELDAIRGIAILLVFWFHGFRFFTPAPTDPLWERLFVAGSTHGGSGVNLFFVLSGFLITGILLDSVNRSDYYSRFYYRRALRILPAYYLLLLILFGLRYISFSPRHCSLAFLGLCFIYLSNLTPLFGVPMQYGVLWSLAVEEHFYLLWPAAVRALTKRVFIIAATSICVIEPFLRLYAVHRGGLWWWTYTWLFADALALGALLAVFARSSLGSRSNLLKLSGLTAVFASVTLVLGFAVPRDLSVTFSITAVNWFALAAVSAILWVGTGPYRSLVNLRVLAFYGYISYGLYLYHGLSTDLYDALARRVAPTLLAEGSFAKVCLRALTCLALATAVAYLSRTTYEEFFLRMKSGARKVPTGGQTAGVRPQTVATSGELTPETTAD
jgi:peptidoglycan/LPS O-acetylase OafA/YrhL